MGTEGQGLEPLLYTAPVLEIAGQSYTVRRLGLLDIQRVARIFTAGAAFLNRKALAHADKMTREELGTFILDFLPHAMDETIDFMASLIGLPAGIPLAKVEERLATHEAQNTKRTEKGKKGNAEPLPWVDPNVGTIRDPSVFPLGSEVRVIQALVEHEDLSAFFVSVKKLTGTEVLKSLVARLSKPSTASRPGTDGPTPTSPAPDLPVEEKASPTPA